MEMGLVSIGSIDSLRLGATLVLSAILSALKVRLPGMEGGISLGFVVLLSAAIELSLLEVCMFAAIGALVQGLWSPAHRPRLVQVGLQLTGGK